MTIFKSKKGTEKPIEIFVALFIILAVAMVILKMFSGQIASKQQQIGELVQQERQEAQQFCNERCVEASSGDCSKERQAAYCLAQIKGGLDLNGNGATVDYDESLLAGIGICEDGVYCPHVATCTCKQKLDMSTCKVILEDYWNSVKGAGQGPVMYSKKIHPGSCVTSANAAEMWCYNLGVQGCGAAGTLPSSTGSSSTGSSSGSTGGFI